MVRKTDQDFESPARTASVTPKRRDWEVYDRNTQYYGDIQRSIGELTEAVRNLTKTVEKHDNKLDEIGKKVHTGESLLKILGVIIVAFGGGVGYLFFRIWYAIAPFIKP